MNAAVAHLFEEVLLLPSDSRTELVEAILERSAPSDELLKQQLEVVARRMENVRTGVSELTPATEAHASVLASLNLRA
ncbi:addiction module protein [Prosthecobacter sp. SYSU 5D2]|uniref:addiction module protein n=1 Tax=Prosthecobacter sp. SYSU 5D2 TaxID=3134134 RepID=UPI0031FE50A6